MRTVTTFAMAVVMATSARCGEAIGQTPPVPAEEPPEVLTQGPVNEVFAQPVDLEAQRATTLR